MVYVVPIVSVAFKSVIASPSAGVAVAVVAVTPSVSAITSASFVFNEDFVTVIFVTYASKPT